MSEPIYTKKEFIIDVAKKLIVESAYNRIIDAYNSGEYGNPKVHIDGPWADDRGFEVLLKGLGYYDE